MTTTEPVSTRNGNRVDVDGVSTYYEVTGSGDPVILLHGGMCTAETFDAQTVALAERYCVYVPERFGHGRTPDIEGAITYENMAQHTIAFMDALGLESARLAGWSDGALVGLLVALRRPKMVRKLVLIDQFVTNDGAPPAYWPFMTRMSIDMLPPDLRGAYDAFSPDGADHFGIVFEKLHKMWIGQTGVALTDLAHVAAPTLILASDDGAMTLEHIAAVHRGLRDSQVAIVPGTSHGLAWEKPHVVNTLILDFLADEQAPKLLALDDFVEHG